MLKECGTIAVSRWWYRRILDRMLWGHSAHTCVKMLRFGVYHNGPHECKCGEEFAQILPFSEKGQA